MKMSIALAILLIASNAPNSAVAQVPNPPEEEEEEEEEEGQICISVGYGWEGSPTDVKQIKEIPVPKSYKTGKGGACGGHLDATHLIRWHLRYGNEDTVQQALNFIEKRDGASDAISAQLDRDLTSALVELDREFEAEGEREDSQLDISKPEKLRSFVANTPSVRKLSWIRINLNFYLLNQINFYLSAAEILGSKRFATQARKVFTQYEAIEKRLLPRRDGGSPDMDIYVSTALEYAQRGGSRGPDLSATEVDLRLTVLEAQLTPSAETFDSARKALKRRYQPAYANAPEVAFSGGDDFCDLYEERFRNNWEWEIAKACKEDGEFIPNAIAYGYADAMLAILTDSNQRASGKWDWEDYVILHQKDMIYNSGQRNYLTGDDERVINLKLALADQHFVRSKAKEKGQWSYEEAWRLLAELSLLVNPTENPVRFRQIAERAIAVDAMMQKEEKGWKKKHVPLLAYYRLNLRNLDKLVIGNVR